MNMEAYRKVIRRRMIVMTVIGVAYVAAMLGMHTLSDNQSGAAGSFMWDAAVEGFVWGAVTAIVACFAFIRPRYVKALRDEQALRRLWNREHDERTQAIRAKAGAPMLLYTSVGMIAAGLLIVNWNMTVAMTLVLTAAVQILISAITKIICMHTM